MDDDRLAGSPRNRAGTNKLTIASPVVGLLGILTVGILSVVGVLLGAVTLWQIKRTGQGGRRIAIAGIALSIASGSVIAGLAISEMVSTWKLAGCVPACVRLS